MPATHCTRGRLARPVLTHERYQLAGMYRQVDAVEHDMAAKALGQPANLEHRGGLGVTDGSNHQARTVLRLLSETTSRGGSAGA